MTVLIVGGSLCGITFALACAKRGIQTHILERAPEILRNGGSLSINRERLLEVVGVADDDPYALSFPLPIGSRMAVSWHALQKWLLQLAAEKPEIVIESGTTVEAVSSGDAFATAATSKGHLLNAPLIVGADGQFSTVRRAVDPEHPAASYAGYMLWRGLTAEASLPTTTDFSELCQDISLVTRDGHRLVGFPIARDTASSQAGNRLLSFVWYDPGRHDLLLELGCIDNWGNVLRAPRPREIPGHLLDELSKFSSRRWPEPWRTVVNHAISRGHMFAHTVAEYYPHRIHAGRIVLIGDAAHVSSPVTARGFMTAIDDSSLLADLLAKTQTSHYVEALKAFEHARLPVAQALAASSRAWSRKFISDPVRAASESSGGLYPLPRRT